MENLALKLFFPVGQHRAFPKDEVRAEALVLRDLCYRFQTLGRFYTQLELLRVVNLQKKVCLAIRISLAVEKRAPFLFKVMFGVQKSNLI